MGCERILYFSTIFNSVDNAHCSVYCYHFTWYSHEHKIYHMHTECWITDNDSGLIVKATDPCTQGASKIGKENIIF